MKAVRRILFWGHLTTGSLTGAVILVLCATGVLLSLQTPVLRWVERAARIAPAGLRGEPRLGAGTLLRLAAEASPGRVAPTAVAISVDTSEAATVSFGRERVLYLDGSSGAVTGQGAAVWRAFFSKVQDVHRWLAFPEERRDAGKAVTGAANILFLGLALSGLYIWWPRLRGIRRVSDVALFHRGLAGKARDFNWHNVLGVWSALPILVITATALPMSYRAANDLVYRIAGGSPPPAPASSGAAGPRRGDSPGGAKPLSAAEAESLDRLFRTAQLQSPGWRAITLRAPEERSPVVFSIEESQFANRFARSTLTLERNSGAIVKWEPYAEASGGRQARSWMRFLHTGEALGPTGQIVAALASASGILLAVTGISLALRRLRAWRARRRAPGSALPDPAAAAKSKPLKLKGAVS